MYLKKKKKFFFFGLLNFLICQYVEGKYAVEFIYIFVLYTNSVRILY